MGVCLVRPCSLSPGYRPKEKSIAPSRLRASMGSWVERQLVQPQPMAPRVPLPVQHRSVSTHLHLDTFRSFSLPWPRHKDKKPIGANKKTPADTTVPVDVQRLLCWDRGD